MTDRELLNEFIVANSQTAFAQLVERHLALVYSAARRILGESHFAEDVAQQSFALLARKARQLGADTIISAWLYRTARNFAFETSRSEGRRRRREQQAYATMDRSIIPPRFEIEPVIDEAMSRLSATDHDVIVLRFFENKSLREIGQLLNASEDAVQKRVSRALDRLRTAFANLGVTTSAEALAMAFPIHAVGSPPASLLSTIISAPFQPEMHALSFSLKTMNATHLKAIGMTAMIVALSVSVVRLRIENQSLKSEQSRMVEVDGSADVNGTAKNTAAKDLKLEDEMLRLRRENLELVSLRGRVAQLTSELRRARTAQDNSPPISSASDTNADSILFTASLTNRVPLQNTLIVGGWAKGNLRAYLLLTPSLKTGVDDKPISVKAQIVQAPEGFWEEIGWAGYKSELRRSSLAGILSTEHAAQLIAVLKQMKGADLTNVSTPDGVANGEKLSFGWSEDDDQKNVNTMMMLDVYPRLSDDSDAITFELVPTPIPPGTQLQTSTEAPQHR